MESAAIVNCAGKCGFYERKAQMAMLEGDAMKTAMETLSVICFQIFSCLGLCLRLLMSTCLAVTNAWVKPLFMPGPLLLFVGTKHAGLS